MVTIKLLGPVSLEVKGRPVAMRSVRMRSLLAAVGLAGGQPVAVRRLVDQLWGANPPGTAVQQVHNTVSQLRHLVAATAEAAGLAPPDWLSTGSDGYRLGPDAEVDVLRFLDDVRKAEQAHVTGQARRAAELLDRGLSRWYGEALSGTSQEIASEALRLESQRRVARVRRIQAALQTGDALDQRQEAENLLAEDPLDEQVRALVIRILHLQGRQGEALHTYREGARLLRRELGVDPGPLLQKACQAVLKDMASRRPVDPPPVPPVPAQLPPAPGAFVGRDEELAWLLGIMTTPPASARPAVVVISGIGGVGKTCLATVASHASASHFPDGQVFVHLRGPSGPLDSREALERVLRALGLTNRLPSSAEELRTLLRTLTANKAILIVADDADSAGQVADLLPSEPRCTIVVTARRRLPALLWSESLELRPLGTEPSRRLLAALSGGPLSPMDDRDIATIVRACAGLPLALTITGARMRTLGPGRCGDLANVLEQESSRLDLLSLGDIDVCETLSQGVAQLGPDARRTLVALSGLSSPSIPDWCVLAACEADRGRALAATDELLTAHLLGPAAESDRAGPRFGMHDLVRLHLRSRLVSDADGSRAALERILRWWLTLARAVSARITAIPFETSLLPDLRTAAPSDVVDAATADPGGWAGREQQNLVAAAQAAALLDCEELVVALVDASRRPLITFWLQDSWETLTVLGLGAARRSGDPRVRGRALLARGSVYLNTGDYPAAARILWLAKELLYGVDWSGAAVAAGNLSGALQTIGEPQAAIRNCDDILGAVGPTPVARSIALRRRADALTSLGRLDAALEDFVEARRQLSPEANWETYAHLLEAEARLYCKLAKPAEARSRLAAAVDSARMHGSRRVEGYLLLTVAEVEQLHGDVGAALEAAGRSVQLMKQLGDQDGEALAAYRLAMIMAAKEPSAAGPWLSDARTLLRATGRPAELAAVEELLAA